MNHGMDRAMINVAIVGLGRISRLHIDAAISQWKDCRVKAVCDVDKKKVREAKEHIQRQYCAVLGEPIAVDGFFRFEELLVTSFTNYILSFVNI